MHIPAIRDRMLFPSCKDFFFIGKILYIRKIYHKKNNLNNVIVK